MVKRIYGDDCGLELIIEEDEIFLCPSKKNKIELLAKNDTEYDMHLFFCFHMTGNVAMDKKEFDVFVPAQGNTCHTLVLSLSSEEKMYTGESVLEFLVKDRVLEWTCGYEIQVFTENVFKCCEKIDYSQNPQMLFSDKGVIYIDKGEYAVMEVANLLECDVTLESIEGNDIKVYVEKELCRNGRVHLKEGLNRLCITAEKESRVVIKDELSGKKVCLNTVNPKYFL
ncbi:MAG: hypothetical protein J6K12_01915 [Clostridia bacterium]|nr:hypothetical protein [Clostridia bacterium]